MMVGSDGAADEEQKPEPSCNRSTLGSDTWKQALWLHQVVFWDASILNRRQFVLCKVGAADHGKGTSEKGL